ncbi:MAG: hypothetical protein AABX04_08430, partial [Nanoarchaeota archaeon]
MKKKSLVKLTKTSGRMNMKQKIKTAILFLALVTLMLSVVSVGATKDTTLEVEQIGKAELYDPVKFSFTVKNIGSEPVYTPLRFNFKGADESVNLQYYDMQLSTGEIKKIPYDKNQRSYGGVIDLLDQGAEARRGNVEGLKKVMVYKSDGTIRWAIPNRQELTYETGMPDLIEMAEQTKWLYVDEYQQNLNNLKVVNEIKQRMGEVLGYPVNNLNSQNIEKYAEEAAQARVKVYRANFQEFINLDKPAILLNPGEYVQVEKEGFGVRGFQVGNNRVKVSLAGVDLGENNKDNDNLILNVKIDKREPLYLAGPVQEVSSTGVVSAVDWHPALLKGEYWLFPYTEYQDAEGKICVTIEGRNICEHMNVILNGQYLLDGKYYPFTVDGQKQELSAFHKLFFKMLKAENYDWLVKNFPGFLSFKVNGVKVTMMDFGTKVEIISSGKEVPPVPITLNKPVLTLNYNGKVVSEKETIEIPLGKSFGDQLVVTATDPNGKKLHVGIAKVSPADDVLKMCDIFPGGTCWSEGHYLNTGEKSTGSFDFYWNPSKQGVYDLTLEAWEIDSPSVKSEFKFQLKVKEAEKLKPELSLTYQGKKLSENGLIEIPVGKSFGDDLILTVNDPNNEKLFVKIKSVSPKDNVLKLC